VQDLGQISYEAAWAYQEQLLAKTVAHKIAQRALPNAQQVASPNYLLLCEHPHVYTLGKSGHESNLLLSNEGLQAAEASFYKTNRGGDITYHGPGQLVVYPIVDLENFFTDIHLYLRQLEEAVIQLCTQNGLKAGRIAGLTGVWLDYNNGPAPRKICAMGVKTSRWVTMHGLALNVNTNLAYFDHIVPCGISDKAVTSLQAELGQPQNMAQIKIQLLACLQDAFGFVIAK
jgi:lipoyl(octanoyl) transferase